MIVPQLSRALSTSVARSRTYYRGLNRGQFINHDTPNSVCNAWSKRGDIPNYIKFGFYVTTVAIWLGGYHTIMCLGLKKYRPQRQDVSDCYQVMTGCPIKEGYKRDWEE